MDFRIRDCLTTLELIAVFVFFQERLPYQLDREGKKVPEISVLELLSSYRH